MFGMEKLIDKIFNKNKDAEIDKIISYYSKRLLQEQADRQEEVEKLIYKIYRYRDELIKNGIDLPE